MAKFVEVTSYLLKPDDNGLREIAIRTLINFDQVLLIREDPKGTYLEVVNQPTRGSGILVSDSYEELRDRLLDNQ